MRKNKTHKTVCLGKVEFQIVWNTKIAIKPCNLILKFVEILCVVIKNLMNFKKEKMLTAVTFLMLLIALPCWSESMNSKEYEQIGHSRGLAWPKGKKLFGPGLGWDFLTASVSGYPLINISYSIGQTTNDELFLVPDCFVVEDRKLVNFYDSSEVIESSSDYTDITAKSMSASLGSSFSVGVLKVSLAGSYSQSFQHMINEQTRSKSVTLRTQYSDHRYTLMMNSDCPLNKGFESFILEIAECLKNDDLEWAEYLAQELVRDFGTHFIKKASLGGFCLYLFNEIS